MRTIKVFFALAIAMYAPLVLAQNKYFDKKYYLQGMESLETRAMIEIKPNVFLLSGGAGDITYNQYNFFLFSIDNYGQVIADISGVVDSANVIINSLTKNTNGYAGAGWIDPDTTTAFFYKVDTLNQTIISKAVGNTQYTNHANTVCTTPDGGFLLGGEIQPYDSTVVGPPTHPYLIRLDAQGNVLWDTIYYDCCYIYYSRINKLIPASEGGYYAIGTRYANFYFGDAMLLKINEDGSIAWSKFIDYGHIEHGSDLVLTPDGGYIIIGAVANHDDFPFTQSGLVVKLNANLEEEWRRVDLFKNYSASDITLTDDGNIFVSGGRSIGNSNNLDVELCKISQDGDLLWQRFYGGEEDDYAWTMLPTQDGGFIMGGRSKENDTIKVAVLKVNCMGLLTEPTAAFAAYQTGDSPLEVAFQNQSQYVYPDSIDGGYYVWDFGDGSPPYVCGRGYEACAGDVVLHNYAAQGQYSVSLTAIVCSDTSTLKQEISVVWTGAEEIAAQGGTWHLSVLPNPAKDLLHIKTLGLAGSGQEGMQFTLYDLTGKAVRQADLSAVQPSATLKVGDLPEGMYFWTCQSNHQAVRSGKITILR